MLKPSGSRVAGIVLAAGMSTRMGRPKQLLPIHGRILLAHVLERVCQSGLWPVILVLGHLADEIEKALRGYPELTDFLEGKIRIVRNPDFASGQASSIRRGLAAMPASGRAAMFVMGDQAGIEASMLDLILGKLREPIESHVVRPWYGGEPGGPVVWGRDYFQALDQLRGDRGGRHIIGALPRDCLIDLELPGEAMPVDIDTEADWQRWLERQ